MVNRGVSFVRGNSVCILGINNEFPSSGEKPIRYKGTEEFVEFSESVAGSRQQSTETYSGWGPGLSTRGQALGPGLLTIWLQQIIQPQCRSRLPLRT